MDGHNGCTGRKNSKGRGGHSSTHGVWVGNFLDRGLDGFWKEAEGGLDRR